MKEKQNINNNTKFFVQKKDKIQSPDLLETIYNETKPNGKYFEH